MNAHFAPANDDTLPSTRMDELNRYFSDPVFRAEMDAKRDRHNEWVRVEIDRQILANFKRENFDEEPGFVAVLRERIAAWEALS